MTTDPAYPEILAVLAAAAAGDIEARVAFPKGASDGTPLQLAAAVNLLLDSFAKRALLSETAHRELRSESERLMAERTQQLRQSEAKFYQAFQASPAAISIAALPEGRWMDLNEAHAKMTGYAREELIGRTSAEMGLVDPSERAKILKAIKEQGRIRDVEIKVRTKSGALVDTLVSVEEVEMNGQRCALTIQYDLTDLKRAEREVRRLNHDLELGRDALQTANKDLEAFSYSVAHDLRTPLRSIDGFSKLLMQENADKLDGQGLKYLENIAGSVRRMAQLIDDLLALSRVTMTELHRSPVDLAGLARRVLEGLAGSQPERKAELLVSEEISGTGDAQLLAIALENLLGNAWKFTSAQAITKIEFGALEKDGTTVYFIRDNGAGFDMAYADKLFGVFQRLHSITEFEGTGIGLATVERVIRRHGGKVWGEGKIGQGATFYFTLGEEEKSPSKP